MSTKSRRRVPISRSPSPSWIPLAPKPVPTQPSLRLVDTSKRPDSVLKLAAKLSLDTGSYVDTKFYVYSRRKQSGTVFAPRAVYANGWLLRTVLPAYFEPLLRGGYEGGRTVGPLDAPFPKEFAEETDTYDYGDDSDLEDDEDEHSRVASTSVTKRSSDKGKQSANSEVSEDNVKDTGNATSTPRDSATLGLGTNGQTLMMPNHAYATWRAFVYYLYTDEVDFMPLRSELKTTTPATTPYRPGVLSGAPPCSPKSMYRLADELGFDELKEKARKGILSKLSSGNILDELFSELSSRYDPIRNMFVDYACNNARGTVHVRFRGYLNAMGKDDLKRCSDTIALLVTQLTAPDMCMPVSDPELPPRGWGTITP